MCGIGQGSLTTWKYILVLNPLWWQQSIPGLSNQCWRLILNGVVMKSLTTEEKLRLCLLKTPAIGFGALISSTVSDKSQTHIQGSCRNCGQICCIIWIEPILFCSFYALPICAFFSLFLKIRRRIVLWEMSFCQIWIFSRRFWACLTWESDF